MVLLFRQSDSVYLSNSVQYSDFNSPEERSWQLRHDLDMTTFDVPGLSFMTRYARDWDADYSDANDVYMRADESGPPHRPEAVGAQCRSQVCCSVGLAKRHVL